MTLYQLQCFIAVAEELNFSAAAERLFTSQPAVTYQINALEKSTGLRLFDRTTRRTKLTAAGSAFYQDMVQLTEFYGQALKKAQEIQRANQARLVVGLRKLFDYGTLASIIQAFQQQYPDAVVDVIQQDDQRPVEELRAGKMDVGFFYAVEHAAIPEMVFEPLFAMRYHVLMNPANPLAGRQQLCMADLRGQRVVTAASFGRCLYEGRGPSLQDMAAAGIDASRAATSMEGALITIQMNQAVAIVLSLDGAVIPGMVKVPLADYPPVVVEIGALRNNPRSEVRSFVELARQAYACGPLPPAEG